MQSLYRPALEIGLTFDPRQSRLDIAGKGAGGSRVFEAVAKAFSLQALGIVDVEQVDREEWRFERFMSFTVKLPRPPKPFATVAVREIAFRRASDTAGKARFRAEAGRTAYDRIRDFGIKEANLFGELIGQVELEFKELPSAPDTEAERVGLTLSWPNRRSFKNALPEHMSVLDAWLRVELVPWSIQHGRS
ncbi:MAG: hypothetical protein AAFQ22_04535 [Pseudomonadota bacterium]